MLVSSWANYIFDSKCYFEFWTLQFSKQNAIFILSKCLFQTTRQFQICPTQILFCSDTIIFIPANRSFHSSKTKFSSQQNAIFRLPKTVSKDCWPTNMPVLTHLNCCFKVYFLGQDCLHNSMFFYVKIFSRSWLCAQLQI